MKKGLPALELRGVVPVGATPCVSVKERFEVWRAPPLGVIGGLRGSPGLIDARLPPIEALVEGSALGLIDARLTPREALLDRGCSASAPDG